MSFLLVGSLASPLPGLKFWLCFRLTEKQGCFHPFVRSFIHPFIQQVFFEGLLSPGACMTSPSRGKVDMKPITTQQPHNQAMEV